MNNNTTNFNKQNFFITMKEKESMYMFLSKMNKFDKYSATIKFHKNNEKEMEELRSIQKQYEMFTGGKKLYIKEEQSIIKVELQTKFKNFKVYDENDKEITNNENIIIPFDSLVDVTFKVVRTKNGGYFPAIYKVKIVKLADKENYDSTADVKSKDYIEETSEIIEINGKLKEVFTRGNEKYYFKEGQKIQYTEAPIPESMQKVLNANKATTNKYENRDEKLETKATPPEQNLNEDDAWYNNENLTEDEKELAEIDQLLDSEKGDEFDEMIPF